MSITNEKLLLENASIGYDAIVLKDIHLPNKNISIFKRNNEKWEQDLKEISKVLLRCKVSGTIDEITDYLQAYFESNYNNYDFLLRDVLHLLNLFSQVSNSSSFRILLTTTESNMCSKFHTDINDLRMLCTYVGPGTLWLSDETEYFKEHSKYDESHNEMLDENEIQQADAGDVVILKGALYPEGNGVLHRSPTIEKIGEKRLLLRIDTNETINFWT